MIKKKVLEMRAKRENAVLKAMEILNKAEKEGRFLSSEEQKEIDKYEDEIRSWDASIKRAERMTAMEPDEIEEKPEVKTAPKNEEIKLKK